VLRLRSGRRRQRELVEREAAGESFWTTDFTPEVRTKVKLAAADTIGHTAGDKVYPYAHGLLTRQWGRNRFTAAASNPTEDVIGALTVGDSEMVPDVIEALGVSIDFFIHNHQQPWERPTAGIGYFSNEMNRIFREERVAYQLIEGEMVDLEAEELHAEVVAPALRLLSGRRGFEGVEIAYKDALREIANGDADDAITDAGTALQEALAALGCSGNSLGPLIADARRRNLLAPHDARLEKAIADVMEWVSADRSQSGEAHHVSSASIEDAWLIVHIVGALILRLASGPPRAGPNT
jgi:hypothetical protein